MAITPRQKDHDDAYAIYSAQIHAKQTTSTRFIQCSRTASVSRRNKSLEDELEDHHKKAQLTKRAQYLDPLPEFLCNKDQNPDLLLKRDEKPILISQVRITSNP